MKLIVIADDFTGACDTGAQLAKNGVRTEVLLTPQQKPSPCSDVLVVNTESRASAAAAAARTVAQVLHPWYTPGQDPPLVFKKIDSTFRGNVGAEVEAAMRAAGKRLAVIAAAIPAAGRTTEQGECRVHQVPLLETAFARDAVTPLASSRIRTLIAAQSRLPVYEIGLHQVRYHQLGSALARLCTGGRAMVVVDAVTDDDLQQIARAALAMPQVPLLVGAAGLAHALPVAAYRHHALPVLVVAGSMNEVTRRQVEAARQRGHAEVVEVAMAVLLGSASGSELQQLAEQVARHLAHGRHCILCTRQQARERTTVSRYCQQHLLTRRQVAGQISQQLGRLAHRVTGLTRIGGLILTGGDTAAAVAVALGAHGYRIAGEVAACIPFGTLTGSEIDDIPVITKAGGFGAESALCDALTFIEERY